MSTKHAVHLATCIATIAFAIAVVLPTFVATPLPWYRPVDRDWVFDVKTTGIAMGFYGTCLYAALAASACGGACYALVRRLARRDPSDRVVAVVTALALATVAAVIVRFAWQLSQRELTPPPMPSWYQPR